MAQIAYPQVAAGEVNNFARVWNYRGLKMLLDDTSRQFAVDFANTVLRSYIDTQIEKVQAMMAAKAKAQIAATPTPTPAKSTGGIILTD